MQVKGKKSCKLALKLGVGGVLFLAVALTGKQTMAQVVGECYLCHTMHNSQSGNDQVFASPNAGWNGSGGSAALAGGVGTITDPQQKLLKSDCVGCHTNTANSDTIVNLTATIKIPIVYNSSGAYPAQALAGGNFNSVASNSTHGHNVRGISPADSLTFAPGDSTPVGGQGGCTSSCHESLTLPDSTFNPLTDVNYRFNGCKGCHTQVAHHNAADTSYRFLGGAGGSAHIDYVYGGGAGIPFPYEDPDWEQTKSDTDHNFYARQDSAEEPIIDNIGSFCAGCHTEFHSIGRVLSPFSPTDNGGDPNDDGVKRTAGGNPWLRHPSSVNLPSDGEYAPLFAAGGAAYNPDIPVAQDTAGDADKIDVGDQVMCLSCHRAHASDQPDALRFVYSGMTAHQPSGADGTGCFWCHSEKDDAP